MSRRQRCHSRQHGVAIVMALLIAALAVITVSGLFWQQQIQVRSIENQRFHLQEQWMLRGALDWARQILRDDRLHSATDNLTETWAAPLTGASLNSYVENYGEGLASRNASLSLNITDAQSRFNLTNLSINGYINTSEMAAFGRLLVNAGFDPMLAMATAKIMADRQSARFSEVDDLLSVPGMTPAVLKALKELLIVLPVPTPVNVNTASAEVLSAKIASLSLADAKTLVLMREKAYFKDIADFNARLPGKDVQADTITASVASDYFVVHVGVRTPNGSRQLEAILRRDTVGKTEVLWSRGT